MRAVVKLEFIAENYFAYKRQKGVSSKSAERYGDYLGRDKSRPWIAKIVGRGEQFGWIREFMKGQIDYSQANTVGSRGVYIYYPLQDGVYEVNERTSWNHVRRYFIRVEQAAIQEISREEIEQWLNEKDNQIRPINRI